MKNVGLYENDLSVPRKKDLDEKQSAILAEGILKGDGAGGVSAAVANTDYATCANLRNGSAEGSLRTVGSKSEDDSYTMGSDAFAEGYLTSASGFNAHAEGSRTNALGGNSHAEGGNTRASGDWSHAEGAGARANGDVSHAEGYHTIARHKSQHVQGEYNIEDDSTAAATERGNYVHMVGNGTASNARSNAHTLDWSGNAWFAGDVYVGSTSGTNKDAGSKKLITADEVPSEVFIATYGTTTYEEIKAAYDVNKVIFCKKINSADDYELYILNYYYNNAFEFSCVNGCISSGIYIDASNAWVSDKKTLVPETRTINGKALSADITLGAVYTATLTAAGWQTSGAWKTQTVSVTGLKATYNAAPFVDVALSGTDAAADAELAAAWLGISASAIADTAADSLTVKFPATVDTPTVNIPIRVTTYD
nr:MAG TPA: hypothetical protein [Caudoviricetes sp.]